MKKLLSFFARPFVIFNIVFSYIFIFSLWWSYLLFDMNRENFHERIEINALHESKSLESYFQTSEYATLRAEYRRKIFMIITEGVTFLVILLIGLSLVKKAFAKEFELARQQKNFLLSVSHELKSPLASMKIALQTLSKHSKTKLDEEKYNRLLHNSLFDIDRLDGLVDNILFAVKIDASSYDFPKERINFSSTVQKILQKIQQSQVIKHKIISKIEEDIFISGDSLGITSVIMNLIENAAKYSDASTEIQVNLKIEKEHLVFSVADQGIGIGKKEKEHIFRKFYRIGNEDTRRTKGTGLGLYIVRRVVEMHHGKIEISDNEPRGTIFIVYLPCLIADKSPETQFSIS